MKGRESGMPAKDVWDGFFHPAGIVASMGLTEEGRDVAEFGCGYGTFTIPAARVIQGTVSAFDIEPGMIAITAGEAERAELRNVKTILRDFMAEGTGLDSGSMDYVMLFNILHVELPEKLLREAWRVLRNHGRLGITHWNYDASTPRGPSMDIRPKPEQCIQWAEAVGFSNPRQHDLKPYHYGILMSREET